MDLAANLGLKIEVIFSIPVPMDNPVMLTPQIR